MEKGGWTALKSNNRGACTTSGSEKGVAGLCCLHNGAACVQMADQGKRSFHSFLLHWLNIQIEGACR